MPKEKFRIYLFPGGLRNDMVIWYIKIQTTTDHAIPKHFYDFGKEFNADAIPVKRFEIDDVDVIWGTIN